MRALVFSMVLVKILMLAIVYGTRLIDEGVERGGGETINESAEQSVNFGFEEKTWQTHASWIVPIMEVLRDKGVIQALFDEGWITISEHDGVIRWETTAGTQGSVKILSGEIPVWQQILHSIFALALSQDANNLQAFTGGRQFLMYCNKDKGSSYVCRKNTLQLMLRTIHSDILVAQKICQLSTNNADMDQCLSAPPPDPSACTVFTVDREKFTVDRNNRGRYATAGSLAVREFRKLDRPLEEISEADVEQGDIPWRWQVDTYYPELKNDYTFDCNPSQWHGKTPFCVWIGKTQAYYVSSVDRYTISGLPSGR